MSRERNQHGQYTREIPAEEALAVFRDRRDQAEPITANDVVELTGWSRRTAHNKLQKLTDNGPLESRQVGARARVWWIPIPRDEAPLSLMGLSQTTIPSTAEEILEMTEIPGRTDEAERQRAEAVLTAYQFLQRERSAAISDIQEYTYERHDFEEGTEKQSPEERQWILYLRDALRELPGVEASPRGKVWNFIAPGGDLDQELEREIDDWILNLDTEITGDETSIRRQQALIQIAYDYLKEEGEAQRSDFEEILPEYTAHYNDFDGFWMYTLKQALAEAPGVEPPKPGAALFRYTGDT